MFDWAAIFGRLPDLGSYAMYLAALPVVWLVFGLVRRSLDRKALDKQSAAFAAGSLEPPSLHPIIDPAKCVGCSACLHACPEGKILGLIDGKAHLLDPQSCIGHGACKTSCPVGAIDLVFGSARRGVDIPVVAPNFESNVPGLFIAGELGGMGLIANAIEQGRQAMESVGKLDGLGKAATADAYDVIIVGGGPAGISASLQAKQMKLNALTLEQDTLGGTVARYPRGKLVMTRPARLPLYGKVKLRRVRKERLLSFWEGVINKTGLTIYDRVRVQRIVPNGRGFDVETSAGWYRARAVLLATGRRGSPKRLGVPGEHLSKVRYQLDDPATHQGQHVLVVGGGDSALEAVLTLLRHRPASITLSHRGAAPARAKAPLRQQFDEAVRAGRVHFVANSHVRAIEDARVVIDQPGQRHTVPNDAIIVCIGGALPTALLDDIGVAVETKYGTA